MSAGSRRASRSSCWARCWAKAAASPARARDLESREQVEELVAELGGHARSLVLIARELRERPSAGRDHRGSAAVHGSAGAAASRRARAEPVRQRGALTAQAAARAAVKAAAAGRFPRRRACCVHRTSPGSRHPRRARTQRWPERSSTSAWPNRQDYGYLRFDPALRPFLLRELDDSARAAAEARWAEATADLHIVSLWATELWTHTSPRRLRCQDLHEPARGAEWRGAPHGPGRSRQQDVSLEAASA